MVHYHRPTVILRPFDIFPKGWLVQIQTIRLSKYQITTAGKGRPFRAPEI